MDLIGSHGDQREPWTMLTTAVWGTVKQFADANKTSLVPAGS
jgi:hypothetical protein